MIDDLKELEKFFKICRKQGVTDISCMGITAKFGDLPNKLQQDESDTIPTDELTPEQLMFYAVNDTGKM
jgi:hypothetical protein